MKPFVVPSNFDLVERGIWYIERELRKHKPFIALGQQEARAIVNALKRHKGRAEALEQLITEAIDGEMQFADVDELRNFLALGIGAGKVAG